MDTAGVTVTAGVMVMAGVTDMAGVMVMAPFPPERTLRGREADNVPGTEPGWGSRVQSPGPDPQPLFSPQHPGSPTEVKSMGLPVAQNLYLSMAHPSTSSVTPSAGLRAAPVPAAPGGLRPGSAAPAPSAKRSRVGLRPMTEEPVRPKCVPLGQTVRLPPRPGIFSVAPPRPERPRSDTKPGRQGTGMGGVRPGRGGACVPAALTPVQEHPQVHAHAGTRTHNARACAPIRAMRRQPRTP